MNSISLRLALLIFVVATVAGGCSRGSSAVVGRAGDISVDAAQVTDLLAELPDSTRTALQADRAALERFVRAELLRRALVAEARTAALDSEPEVARLLERAREDALARLWIARQAQVADEYPSEQDLELAYQRNLEGLTPPAQYRVAQIFVSAPNGVSPDRLADAMRKAAEVGSKIPTGDFAALAREYSEHGESAAQGGDVGLLPANQLLPEVAAAVRGLAVGDSIGPVKTSQGLHYVKLLEKEVAPAPSFEDAREQLRVALRARRQQELEQGYLAALKAKLDVAVDQVALAEIEAADGKAPGN